MYSGIPNRSASAEIMVPADTKAIYYHAVKHEKICYACRQEQPYAYECFCDYLIVEYVRDSLNVRTESVFYLIVFLHSLKSGNNHRNRNQLFNSPVPTFELIKNLIVSYPVNGK